MRSTRSDEKLSLHSSRGSKAGKRQFAYRAAAQYNELPPELAEMTVSQFKRALKSHLTTTRADDV